MIINTPETTTSEGTTFTMKASASAFKILSSSMYTDKELAVLRELSANAWDAHVAAGILTPIRVCLPTNNFPQLVVTDYGTGMTAEQVNSLYSTYFMSTKQNSEDMIGGFGIGSKSPFAISETFHILTNKDGICTTAEAVRSGANGLPTLLNLQSSPTSEPNGTTVTVPVPDSYTARTLRNCAVSLYKYWPVTPIVTGIDTTTKVEQYEAPNLTPTASYVNHYQVFQKVVVGQFAYDIPSSLMKRIEDKHGTRLLIDKFTKKVSSRPSFVLYFPSSGLELSPSRETLEDTDTNAITLYNALVETIISSIGKIASISVPILTALAKMWSVTPTTLKEYRTRFSALTDDYPSGMIKLVLLSITTRGTDLTAEETLLCQGLHSSQPRLARLYSNGRTYYDLERLIDEDQFITETIASLAPVYRLKRRYSRATGTYKCIAASHDNVYLNSTFTIDKPSNVTNFYNENRDDVPTPNLTILPQKDAQAYVDFFADIIPVLPAGTFPSVKKVSSGTRNAAVRDKPVFATLYSNIIPQDTYSAKEFYSNTYPDDTIFIVLNHSVKSAPASDWHLFPLLYIPNPVVVVSLLSPETGSKRWTDFIVGRTVELVPYDTTCKNSINRLHPYVPPVIAGYLLEAFLTARYLQLEVPTQHFYTYKKQFRNYFRYLKLIMSRDAYKFYRTHTRNLHSLGNDLLDTYDSWKKASNFLHPLPTPEITPIQLTYASREARNFWSRANAPEEYAFLWKHPDMKTLLKENFK